MSTVKSLRVKEGILSRVDNLRGNTSFSRVVETALRGWIRRQERLRALQENAAVIEQALGSLSKGERAEMKTLAKQASRSGRRVREQARV